MQNEVQTTCDVESFKLEIRDELSGNLIKTIFGNVKENKIWEEYPDGHKEILSASE